MLHLHNILKPSVWPEMGTELWIFLSHMHNAAGDSPIGWVHNNTEVSGGLWWGVVQQTEAGRWLLSPKALLISFISIINTPTRSRGIVQRISCCVLTSAPFSHPYTREPVTESLRKVRDLSLTHLCSHIKQSRTKCGNHRSSSHVWKQLIREPTGLRVTDVTGLCKYNRHWPSPQELGLSMLKKDCPSFHMWQCQPDVWSQINTHSMMRFYSCNFP